MKNKKKPAKAKRPLLRRGFLWRNRTLWQRIGLIIIAGLLVFYAQVVAVSDWYINKHKNEPLHIGVTFIPSYAEYFGLDPHQTMLALRDDLGFRRFRLVSYWDSIEPTPGKYDFSELDWEFQAVQAVGGKVTLSIGMRQPRWPECHIPDYEKDAKASARLKDLIQFDQAVINHYKNNPALESYQLENEYFLGVFGVCPPANRQDLITEFNAVKATDSNHPVIMSLSNNYFGIPLGQPRPDQFGISVYKRVFDQTVTHRYFEYPFTPRYYAWRSGLTEIFTGKSSMLHELQAEPWPPPTIDLKSASIAEQNKSMDAARLHTRIKYGVDTGYRDIDLWGGEWWYWRKEKLHDPSLWNVIKQDMKTYDAQG
jgi:hypothetical protein